MVNEIYVERVNATYGERVNEICVERIQNIYILRIELTRYVASILYMIITFISTLLY